MVPGFLLLRLRAHRLLLAAALLSVLLTTCAVAALAAFSDAVGDAGLRRALQGPSAGRTLVDVYSDVSGKDTRQVDSRVRKAVAKGYDGLPVHVWSSTRSASYGLPTTLRPAGAPRSGDPDLTLFASLERSRVTLVEGTFPGAPRHGSPMPVALPETAARSLGLRPGDEVTLADRLGGPPLRVRLTGLYRPADPGALYWRLDPLAGHGVRTESYTTYGPLLVDPRAFTAGVVAPNTMQWIATADFSSMTTGRMDRVGQDVRRTVQGLEGSDSGAVSASSALPDLLAEVKGGLLVSRSTLLISTLQLVLLAALSLLLVASLLAGERTGETAQLRARGGSRARIAALSAAEALLLVVPAAVAGPLLAGPLVRLLAGHGALPRAGVRLEPSFTTAAWAAALTALACALIVLAPALRRSGTYAGEHAAAGRRRALPAALQAGADLSLVVLAALAYWQLSGRDTGTGVLSSDTTGKLGLDPVLVVAPALCLLAGAVVALRLLPLAARLGERRAARSHGLYGPLVGWQLSRRPGRGAGPALLLVFAVSLSMFAIAEDATWSQSQRDQADFAAGSDIRVDGSATPPFGQGGVYDRVPGIKAVSPSARTTVSLPQDQLATLLTMDAPAAGRVMRSRDDLSSTSMAELMKALRTDEAAAVKEGFALPADAARLRVTLRIQASGTGGRGHRGKAADDLYTTVVDRYGVPYTFSLGQVPADGRLHTLEVDFAAEAGRAAGAAPAGPLRVTSFQARYPVPPRNEHHRLAITGVAGVTADGTARAVPAPSGATWTGNAAFQDPDVPRGPGTGYLLSSAASPRSDEHTPLTVDYQTGQAPYEGFHFPEGASEAFVTLRAGVPAPQALPAVVTDAFLRAVDAKVGAEVPMDLAGGVRLKIKIIDAVRALPTTGNGSAGTDGGALLMDLASVERALSFHDATPLEPAEWWLATEPGATGQVAKTLRARGDIRTVLVRDEARAELSRDPLGAGPLSALPATVVAATVLAAVGFAVASVGTVRERSAEFAVLRALGVRQRSLARVIAAEQGVLVVVAVAVGVGLGGFLTRLIVPLIVLTSGAQSPVPAVRVVLPTGPLLPLIAVVALLPLLAVVLSALRAEGPARVLRRQGGE
ncbi:FtsX-like permease family protein [Streptomyces sp. ME19-03-3]|nr:FtsX-like permease family protein [Streptomyces sp. ME19-03-3]